MLHDLNIKKTKKFKHKNLLLWGFLIDILNCMQMHSIGRITELSRPGFSIKNFEKLRLGFELLMFYYVEPSSVFLKPSFILRLRFC